MVAWCARMVVWWIAQGEEKERDQDTLAWQGRDHQETLAWQGWLGQVEEAPEDALAWQGRDQDTLAWQGRLA